MTGLFDDLPTDFTPAIFSPCRKYRYTLRRKWAEGPCVAFLCFNPSTADETLDDATIRKCRGFAQRWGYGSMVIINLFAIRGTDPKTVGRTLDPVGEENDTAILGVAIGVDRLVCAWGCGQHMKGILARRPAAVLAMIREYFPNLQIECLGYSQDGSPRHPLMLAYTTQLEPYKMQGGINAL